MRQRTISSVGVVAVGLTCVVLGGPFFALLMIVIALAGIAELDRMLLAAAAPRVYVWLVTAWVVVLGGLGALAPTAAQPVAVVFLGVAGAFIVALFSRRPSIALISAAGSIAAGLYLALPVYTALLLRNRTGEVTQLWVSAVASGAAISWPASPRGLAWVLLTVVLVWVGDSVAYLGGRAFGRTKLAPAISPNKTVEGAVAGLVGSVLAAVVVNVVTGLALSGLVAIAIGVCLGVVSQVGDLIESLVKRQLGAKDSGTSIPGHGGVLDRVDSLLLALPTAWILASLIDGASP